MHTNLSTATLLAACLAALGSPAKASDTNGFGVGTSASTGVSEGVYGTFAGNVAAYRVGQDSSSAYTRMIDTVPVNLDNCAERWPFGDTCLAVQGGTAVAGYDETSSNSVASLTFAKLNETPARQAAASAHADLSTATLGATGTTDYLQGAQAFAAYQDTLSFSVAGATQSTVTQITVHLALDGSFNPGPSGSSIRNDLGFGGALASIGYSGSVSGNILTIDERRSANGGWVSYGWDQATPDLTVFTGVYALTGASQSLGVYSGLSLSAGWGARMLYGNTSAVTFDLPTGVSFTSASGVFLASVSAVPEPGSWALLLAGLGLVGALAKRHRRSR